MKSQAIVFTQNKTVVTADKYVAHELYKRNEGIISELGGHICKGVGGFRAEFPNASKAKQFVAKAVTEIPKREYNASRKSEPKKVVATKKTPVTKGKGKAKASAEFITLTDDNGNTYKLPMSALGVTKGKGSATPKKNAPAPKKGKGNATATTTKTIKDFEPKKVDGYYVWGGTKSTIKSGHYMAMRKAYCVFKATDGKYTDSKVAYANGVSIDYDGAYAKAKAEFSKKFPYVTKANR